MAMVCRVRTAMRFLLIFFAMSCVQLTLAAESFLKPNDVIALVGGEDMVVASELGHLEAFVQKALPEHHLKFRSLAWEGDTVFEQRRDLNYPSLEAQLDKTGATVVIAQFGQLESLAGPGGVADFTSAYEKLIARLRGGKERRFVLLEPGLWRPSNFGVPTAQRNASLETYRNAVADLAKRTPATRFCASNRMIVLFGSSGSRDGMHLDASTQRQFATAVASDLLLASNVDEPRMRGLFASDVSPLNRLVAEKNRLWFNYARPQNWAFLAGDRTNQPSSRDHRDLTKRWFPSELEQFVALIEAKEQEIWKLASELQR